MTSARRTVLGTIEPGDGTLTRARRSTPPPVTDATTVPLSTDTEANT
jgi:hypothetical protein